MAKGLKKQTPLKIYQEDEDMGKGTKREEELSTDRREQKAE